MLEWLLRKGIRRDQDMAQPARLEQHGLPHLLVAEAPVASDAQ